MFFRRRIVEKGLIFDTTWKALGDWEWMLRVKESGACMGLLDEFLSSFARTADNRSTVPVALREVAQARAMAPRHVRLGRPVLRAAEYGRKFRAGYYRQAPFHYEIFPPGEETQRMRFEAEHPTFYWKRRMPSS